MVNHRLITPLPICLHRQRHMLAEGNFCCFLLFSWFTLGLLCSQVSPPSPINSGLPLLHFHQPQFCAPRPLNSFLCKGAVPTLASACKNKLLLLLLLNVWPLCACCINEWAGQGLIWPLPTFDTSGWFSCFNTKIHRNMLTFTFRIQKVTICQ